MLLNQTLVVIMPAYNAERTLAQTHREVIVQEIVDHVIVVDDASRDRTADLARNLPRTRLVVHPANRGYGANQKTGYAAALAAGADIVVMVHPDYQYPPTLIPDLAIPLAEGRAACALGSRMLHGLAKAGGMPAWKRAANRLLTAASNRLLDARLSEFHTGFRAYTADLLRRLPLEANSDDFLFDHQILAQILWLRAPIVEIPCPARYFPDASTIALPQAIRYGFGCLFTDVRFRLARRGWMRPPPFLQSLACLSPIHSDRMTPRMQTAPSGVDSPGGAHQEMTTMAPLPVPTVLGLKRSFGFGDRLGMATPGHLAAVRGTSFAPIFAQQSIRELARTQRQPGDVMKAAAEALARGGWTGPWGSDADHLQTEEDVARTAAAGFTMFTLDPSAHVNRDADALAGDALESAHHAAVKAAGESLFDRYHRTAHTLDDRTLTFDDMPALKRAVVKYGAALRHTRLLADRARAACAGRPFEIEMSVDETAHPTSPLEHLLIGLELKRLGVPVVSLAPRFIGDFEKGVDYKGDLAVFEEHYLLHVRIARYCGPYKLSIHSGSDKFSIYPVIGRLSGEMLHVKTAGTSYLEALRVVCRTEPKLFREMTDFCRDRYDTDKATYHVSARLSDLPASIPDADLERWFLEENAGRQVLHVTFGSLLQTGKTAKGRPFKTALMDTLARHADLYSEVLQKHLGKHLRLLGG
jgi:hypothetical protein